MKYIVILCFFLFSCQSVFSQSDSVEKDSAQFEYNDHDFSGLSAFYIQNQFYFESSESIVSNNDNPFISGISIGTISKVVPANFNTFPGYCFYTYYLQKQVNINDSTTQKLNGYSINLPFLGQRILQRKHVFLFISEGFEFGRIKLTNKANEKMKNPFLSPYVGVVVGARFKKLSIVFMSQFDYDVSKRKWKDLMFADEQAISLPTLNQSKYSMRLGLLYTL